MTSVQETRKQLKPLPNEDQAFNVFCEHWSQLIKEEPMAPETVRRDGLLRVKVLDSYDDANFYLTIFTRNNNGEGNTVVFEKKREYLMKFYNAMETTEPDILYGLSLMLNTLTDRLGSNCLVSSIISPLPEKREGNQETEVKDLIFYPNCLLADGSHQTVAVRVFDWIVGDTLSNHLSKSNDSDEDPSSSWVLFNQLGNALGLIYHALQEVDHPSFHRTHLWDLAQFPNVTSLITFTMDDPILYDHIVTLQGIYRGMVSKYGDKLPTSLIMGDANDANVIVKDNRVVGLIDFSDAIVTWSVNELAIAMAYGLVSGSHSNSYVQIVTMIFLGYLKHRLLTNEELQMLPMLMATRLATSVMVGAYSISKEPDNEYLKLHALPARKSLKFWMTNQLADATLPPSPPNHCPSFEKHSKYFEELQNKYTMEYSNNINSSTITSNDIDWKSIVSKYYP